MPGRFAQAAVQGAVVETGGKRGAGTARNGTRRSCRGIIQRAGIPRDEIGMKRATWKSVDRLAHAERLCRGARVLDIGGRRMPASDPASPFARVYDRLRQAATEYRIVDIQDTEGVDYVLDLNQPPAVGELAELISACRPDVILCMETLEHVNCHYEVMNVLADAVEANGTVVFITLPNNRNWVLNAMGWNEDHCVAFFRDIADRFVSRSGLGRHAIERHACMQKYLWYWWVVYALAFGQPLSWGFTIRPRATASAGTQAPGEQR
tara:strand:+ start:3137 stop:3931 length:795 start_codon:yes stop_codon:yes gene_type:complete